MPTMRRPRLKTKTMLLILLSQLYKEQGRIYEIDHLGNTKLGKKLT